jgi:hypothetical protein
LEAKVGLSVGGSGLGVLFGEWDVASGPDLSSAAIRGTDLLGEVDGGVEVGVVAGAEAWLEVGDAKVVPAEFRIISGPNALSGVGKRLD